MESTCNRCHQPIPADSCFCPSCGLPQLVYSAEPGTIPTSAERWPEAVRDASSIEWKPGMKAALALAVPAGLLSSTVSRLSAFGIFWMAGAAAWAVVLYMRSQRPAWITIGAGARIGLVTGLIAAWIAFGASGARLFVDRVVRHQGGEMDSAWRQNVDTNEQLTQQFIKQLNISIDTAQATAQHYWMLSPETHAGIETATLVRNYFLLMLCAMAGGALGARMLGRRCRPEI